MGNRLKSFVGMCVSLNGQDINDMKDHPSCREITRETFIKHVGREKLWDSEERLGYERHPKRGLTMAGDWHVGYFKSVYRGYPCVYFVHSAIEHVFI